MRNDVDKNIKLKRQIYILKSRELSSSSRIQVATFIRADARCVCGRRARRYFPVFRKTWRIRGPLGRRAKSNLGRDSRARQQLSAELC